MSKSCNKRVQIADTLEALNKSIKALTTRIGNEEKNTQERRHRESTHESLRWGVSMRPKLNWAIWQRRFKMPSAILECESYCPH